MRSALQALTKFRRLAESHEVDEVVAAATSAVREAENGREFLAAIRQRTGIEVRVISGTEEARLIHRAAVYGVDVSDGAALVIDIGGGSVELTLGRSSQVRVAHSLKLGVIRLTERFVHSDPVTGADERRLVSYITDVLTPNYREDPQPRFRPRGRDVGHHPQPRRAGRRGRPGGRLGRAAQPAGEPQAAPARPAGPDGAGSRRAHRHSGARSAARGPGRRRLHPHLHDAAAARRTRADALRSGPARGAGAGLHPPQPGPHRPGGAVPGRAAAQRHRAGRALQLQRAACPSGGADGAGAVRPDIDDPRPGRARSASGWSTRRHSTTSASTSATAGTTSTPAI